MARIQHKFKIYKKGSNVRNKRQKMGAMGGKVFPLSYKFFYQLVDAPTLGWDWEDYVVDVEDVQRKGTL